MDNRIYSVIMAGGIGSRFWPMSRTSMPKQFIDILGTGKTLLQQTYERLKKVSPAENILIVTNDTYKELVLKQLPEIKPEQVLCEPARRNTAPCIAYACYKIAAVSPEARMIVAPSDHLVLKEDEFVSIANEALEKAGSENCLITIGVKPTRPDTGYGYIQFDDKIEKSGSLARKVKTFTEKPELEMAKRFIDSGDFYWNSGIFLWSVKSILQAFETHLKEVNDLFADGKEKLNTAEEEEFIKKVYQVCPNVSIDFGLMEKATNVYMMLSDFGWSDLGTWGSMYEHTKKDNNGNAVVGKNALLYESSGNIVNIPASRLVVLQGINDLIIVETETVLLICKKEDEQKIRNIVNEVKMSKGEKYS
jgi:mannose-1-phosphate guanylyltransferase